MKNIHYFLISSLLICMSCVKNTEVEESCIDESLINEQAACYLIYAPVCGCNDVTYSNDCVAQNNCVLSFTEGACEETN